MTSYPYDAMSKNVTPSPQTTLAARTSRGPCRKAPGVIASLVKLSPSTLGGIIEELHYRGSQITALLESGNRPVLEVLPLGGKRILEADQPAGE